MDQVLGGVTLGVYVVFLVLAFGVRALLHRRRTGSAGFNGFHGRTGSAEWWAGVLFVVAVAAGAAAPALQLAGTVTPLVSHWLLAGAGAVVALAGIGATLWAQGAMGAAWRVGVNPSEATSLVTDGPFAVVRNPIFTAMIVAAFGLTLLAPNVVALAAFAALLAAISLQIRVVEEPHLTNLHGDAYRAYTRRVGRLIPGMGRVG